MPGKKCKAPIDLKQVAAYRQKLRRPAGTPLKLTNRERKKFTFKAPFPQRFSIPPNILRYIARNPSSPNGHLKFISTCKSLARMSRIIPVRSLYDSVGNCCYKWMADGKLINLKDRFFNLWVYDTLCIWGSLLPNIASTLVKHIHKFSLRELVVRFQELTFEELQILVSGGQLEHVWIEYMVFKNADGSITEFEKLFELLCCKNLQIYFPNDHHGIGTNTTSKIIEFLSSDRIPVEQRIDFLNIPEDFNLTLLFKFLKENMIGRQHSLYLSFANGISDAYKNQLQEFVNEIILIRGIFAHTVPIIYFPGQNEEAYDELLRMRDENVEGILRKF